MAEDHFGILGKVIAGTYLVEQVVAEGGFGVVYRAYHRGFRARVALKCLKIPGTLSATQRAQFLDQFRAEAEVLFRLSAVSPTIVRPLHVDTFSHGGQLVPFMALEWLDGWTLDAIVAQRISQGRPPIGLRKLVRMLTPVARAIDQAHALPGVRGMSIVHRDLKPENLFVAFIGGEQVVKILDFGISKVTAGGSWVRRGFGEAGLVSFSPAYGSPEQWAPEQYGPTGTWTDVWGLALTVVEAAKGREVFSGDPQEMRAAILDPLRRPTPRREGVRVSDEVEAIFQRALAADPKSRYASVRAFWDDLLDALDLDAQGAPRWSRLQDPRAEGSSLPDGLDAAEGSQPPRLTALPPPRWSTPPPGSAGSVRPSRPPGTGSVPPTGSSGPRRGSSPPGPLGGAPGPRVLGATPQRRSEPPLPRWQPPPELESLEFEPPAARPEWPPLVPAPVHLGSGPLAAPPPGGVPQPAALEVESFGVGSHEAGAYTAPFEAGPFETASFEAGGPFETASFETGTVEVDSPLELEATAPVAPEELPSVPALEIPAAPQVPRVAPPVERTPIELAIEAVESHTRLPATGDAVGAAATASSSPAAPGQRSSRPPSVAPAPPGPLGSTSRPPPADTASSSPARRSSAPPPAATAQVVRAGSIPPGPPGTELVPPAMGPTGTGSIGTGSGGSWRPSAPPGARSASSPGFLGTPASIRATAGQRTEPRISWGHLAAAVVLLVAAVGIAAMNQSHASARGGEALVLGPLPATWISLGLFLVAVAMAVWSLVRRPG
jgi:serine/threonine-protein kinase